MPSRDSTAWNCGSRRGTFSVEMLRARAASVSRQVPLPSYMHRPDVSLCSSPSRSCEKISSLCTLPIGRLKRTLLRIGGAPTSGLSSSMRPGPSPFYVAIAMQLWPSYWGSSSGGPGPGVRQLLKPTTTALGGPFSSDEAGAKPGLTTWPFQQTGNPARSHPALSTGSTPLAPPRIITPRLSPCKSPCNSASAAVKSVLVVSISSSLPCQKVATDSLRFCAVRPPSHGRTPPTPTRVSWLNTSSNSLLPPSHVPDPDLGSLI